MLSLLELNALLEPERRFSRRSWTGLNCHLITHVYLVFFLVPCTFLLLLQGKCLLYRQVLNVLRIRNLISIDSCMFDALLLARAINNLSQKSIKPYHFELSKEAHVHLASFPCAFLSSTSRSSLQGTSFTQPILINK
jgi:hypothetical protein